MSMPKGRKPDGATEFRADVVYERLRDAIVATEFRPNQRLVEEELAAWLGVSRTPVREALLALRQDGLVVQRKGWMVRDHSPQEVLDIVEARAGIEAHAAFLAAGRMSEDDLSRLEELLERMQDPGLSRLKLNELNNEFHDVITEGAGNALLTQFYRRAKVSYWNFNQPVVFTPADDQTVDAQHRLLVAALRAKDGESAARIAREHVNNTARIIVSSLGIG